MFKDKGSSYWWKDEKELLEIVWSCYINNNNISIREVIESMTSNKIKWRKKNSHSQPNRHLLVGGFLFLFQNNIKTIFKKLKLKLVSRQQFLYYKCLAPTFQNNFQNTKNKKIIVWETIHIFEIFFKYLKK